MDRACCSSTFPRRALLLAAVAAAALLPLAARSHEPAAPPLVVAEALFLCDHLPPGGRDVNLSVLVRRREADPDSGGAQLAFAPRAQLAMALSDRVGFTADVGIATEGEVVHAPGASLKLLLRPAAPGRTGLAASLDVFGSTHALGETEAGLGLGAIRSFGRVALRAGASVASGVASWSPHLHAGASAAAAIGARWRALAEVVADVAGGSALVSAGPTLKLALGDATAVMAGALFPVTRGAGSPTVAFQLTRAL
ncbi:MAG TPA: hypothetical protein VFL83_15625 [Anaeromyxobacter sp.]|nr:hypothetical protein [Anaeromyxobacter sp.]